MKLKKITIICIFSLFFSVVFYASSQKKSSVPIRTIVRSLSPTPTITLSPTITPTPAKKNIPSIPSTQTRIIIMTPVPTTNTPSSIPAANNSPSQTQISVHLSINNGSDLVISLAAGANQCDILSEALKQGKINSLSMKYNDSLKTYGVYQINGIGSDSQIWWTYKVNGVSPPQGCSYIKADNNDSVSWLYIGS